MKSLSQLNIKDIIEFAKGVDKTTWVKLSLATMGAMFFLIVVVVPAWIERPLLRRDIQSMEAQIRQVNALNQKKAVWEEDQKKFSGVINGVQERLYTQEALGLLLGKASKLAANSRVDLLASKPLKEKVDYPVPYNAKYQANVYLFTLQGGYHDVGALVGQIENNERLLRVQSIHIVPSEKAPERHIVELKLAAISAPLQSVEGSEKANAKK